MPPTTRSQTEAFKLTLGATPGVGAEAAVPSPQVPTNEDMPLEGCAKLVKMLEHLRTKIEAAKKDYSIQTGIQKIQRSNEITALGEDIDEAKQQIQIAPNLLAVTDRDRKTMLEEAL